MKTFKILYAEKETSVFSQIHEIEQEVNEHLQQGYELMGQPFIQGNFIYQAVIKDDIKETE